MQKIKIIKKITYFNKIFHIFYQSRGEYERERNPHN